ncbi:Enoyl-CoA delta isomerase 2, mitochondrial [Holothuria leucospilota]|uniref:Enoyl-CoA delta isomerase 2, mitochondrial n=1 Tax=Holothuria leucospilota TaxID=206669 RepID=A0A9Q1CC19_HOLLE|nr:Enoyl-CoA delta isomerase 2, mitochondrial [Holothuria leucospilota]
MYIPLNVKKKYHIFLHHCRSGITPVLSQTIHSSRVQFQASEADFDAAKERPNSLKEDPGNEVKLKIYALFKQASGMLCGQDNKLSTRRVYVPGNIQCVPIPSLCVQYRVPFWSAN